MNSLLRTHRRRGFTLIELMVVMTIVLILSGIAFAGFAYANRASKRKGTISTMKAIQERLTDYFGKYGGYPTPASPEAKGNVDNESWPVGGAAMLYQVMSADGNDQIAGGDKPSTGEQGSDEDRAILWPEVVAPQRSENKKKTTYVRVSDEGTFFMMDSFGHPFMYQKAKKDRNGLMMNKEEMHSNNDYEMWSWGSLSKPSETGDSRGEADWVTSWNEQ